MRRDPGRSRDYDGLVHVITMHAYEPYACGSVHFNEAAHHGVWVNEPTTCLWCAVGRKWR